MTTSTAVTVEGDEPIEPVTPLSVPEVARLAQLVLARVGTVVVEMDKPLRIALAALLAGGDVLVE
jgi:MoxR-like ATPase